MADGLVQQDAVPAGAQDDVHLARRAGHGVEVHQGLAQRLLGLVLPVGGADPVLETGAAAGSGEAVLAAAVLLDGHLHIDARQRAHIADQPAVGAQDLHRAPLAGHRGHDLDHPGIASPAPGVDLLQQGDFLGEGRRGGGIVLAIELGVGGARRLVRPRDALITALGQGGRGRRPADRGFGNLAGVGVARGLAGHHPQAEALGRIIGRRLQPAVIEQERFALGALNEQLAVVGALQRVPEDFASPLR